MTSHIIYSRWEGQKYNIKYKKNMKLTNFQFEAIIGLMLGDLSAERAKSTHNTRLRFEQSLIEHESYLWFLFSIFENLVVTKPKKPKRKPHPLTGIIYNSLSFKTLTFSFLNIFHELFYFSGKKNIPINIAEYFTSVSLAFWIMDDGMKAGPGLRLCTESYSYSDIIILIEMLKNKFQIKSSPQKRSNETWRIYILASEMPKLRELVKPHMHNSMLYKIEL